jgi:hypothetical protein
VNLLTNSLPLSDAIMTEKRPKGILKNTLTAEQKATADRAPTSTAREVAIQHAQIIQDRKDIEGQILDSIILLSEHPQVRIGPYSASNPSVSDVADFKHHVRLFQPSDYDALIEERNANGLCGYALCSQPRSNQGRGGEWKITSTGIAKRKELEKWCSKSCAKRALYVKVQLNETAAWERAGIPTIQIELMDEGKLLEESTARAAQDLERLKLEEDRHAAEVTATLALERGQPSRPVTTNLVALTIREKETIPPKQGVSFDDEGEDVFGGDHLAVEGHKPKAWMNQAQQNSEKTNTAAE